jgi:hypothetical protein
MEGSRPGLTCGSCETLSFDTDGKEKKGKRNGRDEKVFLFEFSGYLCENPF